MNFNQIKYGRVTIFLNGVDAAASYDADAKAFFDRVAAAGGTLSSTEKTATNQLVIDMKAANIWTAMKVIYPMVGASAAACAQNLKSSSFTGTFTSGWTFASTGVTPNGVSAYMDTNLNALNNLTLTSTHLSAYVRNNTIGSMYDLACGGSVGMGSNITALITRYITGSFYIEIGGSTYTTSSGTSDSKGFTLGTTNGSRTQYLYKNGNLITSGGAAPSTFSNNNLYLGAANGGGTAVYFSDKQYTFVSIGNGLDATQAANFYTSVQTFQTTLSRQV